MEMNCLVKIFKGAFKYLVGIIKFITENHCKFFFITVFSYIAISSSDEGLSVVIFLALLWYFDKYNVHDLLKNKLVELSRALLCSIKVRMFLN